MKTAKKKAKTKPAKRGRKTAKPETPEQRIHRIRRTWIEIAWPFTHRLLGCDIGFEEDAIGGYCVVITPNSQSADEARKLAADLLFMSILAEDHERDS